VKLLSKERLEDEIKEVRKLHQGCRDVSWALYSEAGVAFLVVSFTTRGGAKATRRTVVHAHGYYF
jgi:hypothetical protein